MPAGFEGEINLALIAFTREPQTDIDTWTPTARQLRRSHRGFRYYELPTISRSVPLARWWLDGAMRAGIPDPEARATTITLYLDKHAFRTALAPPIEETIFALLVNRAGRLLWRAAGGWTAERGRAVQRVVEDWGVGVTR